jgi:hypothetical protein
MRDVDRRRAIGCPARRGPRPWGVGQKAKGLVGSWDRGIVGSWMRWTRR